MKIVSIVRITVEKYCGYGYLKDIVVKRANKKEYMFKEADFPSLHLNDIEDIVEDVQLRVESYQTKLNLTKPQVLAPGVDRTEQYTIFYKPEGVTYKSRNGKRRLMQVDKVCKFRDAMLMKVREELRMIDEKIKNTKGVRHRGYEMRKDRKERMAKEYAKGIKNMSKEYTLAWRGSVDVGRDNLNFKFKYHMWDKDVKDVMERILRIHIQILNLSVKDKDKGACVRMLEDKKYNKVECVRECELSCWRIIFWEGFSEEGLGFVVVRKGDEDDN
ncbi:hypothetical protein Tco_0115847 [Tanacetum coccineum]